MNFVAALYKDRKEVWAIRPNSLPTLPIKACLSYPTSPVGTLSIYTCAHASPYLHHLKPLFPHAFTTHVDSSENKILHSPKSHVQFSSVAQSCPSLCDPMDCSTPGFPVHHQLPELAQTHVHPAIFSSCLQSFPASGSFSMSQLFTSGGQSIEASASASFLPKKSQGWSPSEWTGWISLQSKGL